jgi:hypothetical protein
MHRLNGHYAQGFNRRHAGVGHVFESRYWSVLVERDAHLLELSRYLPRNPVRAGICNVPEAWPWSSCGATLGVAPRPPFLTVEWLLAHFGSDVDQARKRFREFVNDASGDTLSSRGLTP